MRARQVLVVGAVVLVVVASVPFLVDVGARDRQSTVAFGDTKAIGLPEFATTRARHSALAIPRAEVFYSQYRYVVGYEGVTTLVADLQTGENRALGRPLSVYVSDFSGTNVSLTADRELQVRGDPQPGWVAAADAYFVVGSEARVPTRETAIVPFSRARDARRFVERYGGRVLRWGETQRQPVGSLTRTGPEWERTVDERDRRANHTVAARRDLLDRPVSVVVGEDAPTLAAAVERAPPNTIVRVPAGTYEVADLTVDKPLTLRGAGPNRTRIVGDGNGSVVTSTASGTAVADLGLAGVGGNRTGDPVPASEIEVDPDAWDYRFRVVHAYGDAGIMLAEANRSLVSNVAIDTTSSGVIARDSEDVVVSNLTVNGTERWQDGFLGVSLVGSRAVVQDTTVVGGKVGVFSHSVRNVVVRNTSVEGTLVGLFTLHGTEMLFEDNTVRDTDYGIYIETESYRSAIVDNTVTESTRGVISAGLANYVHGNVFAHNDRGVLVEGYYTHYTDNVVAGNDIGLRVLTLFPTNHVTDNDVVANDVTATVSGYNVLHVWEGNYWGDAPGLRTTASGRLVRPYRPTSPVDGAVDDSPYTYSLAFSPALSLLRQLQRSVPGLQSAGLVDVAPRTRPVHPGVLANVTGRDWRRLPAEPRDGVSSPAKPI